MMATVVAPVEVQEEEEVEYPLNVDYCGVCTMPPEVEVMCIERICSVGKISVCADLRL